MRILFVFGTPAHVHFFKNSVLELTKHNHKIEIAIPYSQPILQLLDANNFEYSILGRRRSSSYLGVMYSQLEFEIKLLQLARKIKPDCLVAFIGIAASHIGRIIGKPSIIFTDSEDSKLQNILSVPFASVVLTPTCFIKNLGKKQIRYNGYKELAYLHPDYFQPDSSIYDGLKIKKTEKYVILRLNAFDAVHDIGIKGFSIADQIKFIEELGKYAHVFISPEGNLANNLESYRLRIPYDRIHHALHFAHLLVSDTQTMTTEAAVLGTPAVRCNAFVYRNDMGNFIELEKKYDMIYSYHKSELALQKAIELIKQPDLKKQWLLKRQNLLSDKINVTKFMVDFIENYPASYNKYRKV